MQLRLDAGEIERLEVRRPSAKRFGEGLERLQLAHLLLEQSGLQYFKALGLQRA